MARQTYHSKIPDDPSAICSEWQDRLGLNDWVISLHPEVPADEMSIVDVTGNVDYTETSKTARIEILREGDFGNRVVPFDWEKTLVHELLHLKLSLVSDDVDALQTRYMHQIIDDLARAFVDAKRDDGKIRLSDLKSYLTRYFDIGDSYTFELTRSKEAFSVGTMTVDDFQEWDDEQVDDLVAYIKRAHASDTKKKQEIAGEE